MKFRYYITNPFTGRVEGTNSEEDAKNFANCEDYFVIDSESGKWMLPGGETEEVENASD